MNKFILNWSKESLLSYPRFHPQLFEQITVRIASKQVTLSPDAFQATLMNQSELAVVGWIVGQLNFGGVKNV